jgi:hypothetical protein
MSDASLARVNPYVGPRAFQRGETLYGRDREVMELLDLLIAERIILLHSPSGAGKTSLIQAALIPRLEREGFHVLPAVRVSLEPALPAEAMAEPPPNRYVLSLLLSLEQTLPDNQQTPLSELRTLTLIDYLDRRREECEQADGAVLIFDQFEEILTVDPTDREAKAEFFEQVGAALRDRRRWALFSMREEFIASLAPYLRPVPTRLDNTYRLELLGAASALQAIQQPAREAGVDFTSAAATKLVDDLRRVRVQQPDGSTEEQIGIHVEPVQLQVVCRRLWDRLPEGETQIVAADVEAVGDVDTALAAYYAERVAGIAAETGVAERLIRDWCDGQLITEQGIRGQVLQGPEASQGLDNRAIWPLVDAHLVRAEKRRGATWFELAHDRLIEPVRANNAAWRMAHLHPLQRQAALWEEHGHPGGLLLRDEALDEAEAWAKANDDALTSVDREFLEACREAQNIAERERRQARRIRWLAIGATLFSILAIVAAIFAGLQTQTARTAALAEATAKSAAEVRLYEAQTAEAQAASAAEAEATAKAAAEALLYEAQTAEAQAASAARSESEARQLAEDLQATQSVLLGVVLDLQSSASATPMAGSAETPAVTPEGTPGGGPLGPSSVTTTSMPDQAATAAAVRQVATLQAVQTQVAGVSATQTAVAPASAFLASNVRDFSSTQGANGWKYLVEAGRNSGQWQEMRFGEYDGKQCWLTDGEDYVRICAGGEVHPGVTTRVAYEWRPAVSRTVGIQVHARKLDTNCGDGVKVEIFKVNEGTGRFEKLGEFGIGAADDVGITGNYETNVAPGTLIYVTTDIFGDAGCDETQIEIEVN